MYTCMYVYMYVCMSCHVMYCTVLYCNVWYGTYGMHACMHVCMYVCIGASLILVKLDLVTKKMVFKKRGSSLQTGRMRH